MSEQPWQSTHLTEIGVRGTWIPIRRELGIEAFGINAWTGEEGAEVIPEHDEVPTGHEELYIVTSGSATFTVDGETVDAPAGTIVFVRDPAVRRGAVALEAGTIVLTVGAKPGAVYEPGGWEENAEIFPLFERGEFAEARELLQAALAKSPESGGLLYNLACAESRLGETDAALEHLGLAVELEPRFGEFARDDDDFAPIREDPRFASTVAGQA